MTTKIIKTKWLTYKKTMTPSIRMWPRQITAYEQILPGFQKVFPEPDASHFPYTILIPEEQLALFRKQGAKMLCLYGEKLDIYEVVQNNAVLTSYPLHEVISCEYGSILLQSWLTLHTPSKPITIHFNSVREHLFKPIIAAFRPSASVENGVNSRNSRQNALLKLEFLRKDNLKYLNIGIKSLLPDSKLLGFVYQPDIHLFKKRIFKKPVLIKYLTCHLSLLTDKELILIHESKPTKGKKEEVYGAIFMYIPHHHIERISFEVPSAKTNTTMAVMLPGNKCLKRIFLRETAVNLDQFQKRCIEFHQC